MRKLVYWVATTLDGFIADEAHGVDAFVNEGEHVTEYLAALRGFDTIVMGRGTYEFGLRCGVTDPYPWAETVVFSRTLAEAPPDPRVRFLSTDAAAEVARMKESDGSSLYLCGGGQLAATLFDAGLVDELVLKVSPTLLGSGVPLTAKLGRSVRLRLRTSATHSNGVLVTRYDVAR